MMARLNIMRVSMLVSCQLLSLITLPWTIYAQEIDVGNFFSPPATTKQDLRFNTVFELGTDTTLKWNTSLTNYAIALYQNQPGIRAVKGKTAVFSTETGQPQEITWKVQTYELKLSESPVYFLWLGMGTIDDVGDPVRGTNGFTSAYFNITRKPAISTTTESETTTPPPSVGASESSDSPSSQTPQDDGDPQDDNGISSGAIAGIVIAVVVGLGLAAVVAWLVFRRHNKKKAAAAASTAAAGTTGHDGGYDEAKNLNGYGEYYTAVPQEVDGISSKDRRSSIPNAPVELEPGSHLSELGPGRRISEMDAGRQPPMELP